ncbi:MAG: PilZ domain-containing protein [Rhizobiaceae bacterium]|nr:PilZ domain-containing protein [Rhizobiaceae bacterium]
MTSDSQDNDRRERRQKVLKGATILTGIANSEIKCTIRNMHTGGAELRVPHNVSIPQDFLLYVPMDGIGYRSTLKWRDGTRVGVAFTGTEPKPGWHYG